MSKMLKNREEARRLRQENDKGRGAERDEVIQTDEREETGLERWLFFQQLDCPLLAVSREETGEKLRETKARVCPHKFESHEGNGMAHGDKINNSTYSDAEESRGRGFTRQRLQMSQIPLFMTDLHF